MGETSELDNTGSPQQEKPIDPVEAVFQFVFEKEEEIGELRTRRYEAVANLNADQRIELAIRLGVEDRSRFPSDVDFIYRSQRLIKLLQFLHKEDTASGGPSIYTYFSTARNAEPVADIPEPRQEE